MVRRKHRRGRARLAVFVLAGVGLLPVARLGMGVLPAWPRGDDTAARATGRLLFEREWTAGDSLAGGDGLGPVFNATSCKACHFQGGLGGGGPLENNVTVFQRTGDPGKSSAPASGVVHQSAVAPEFQETLRQVVPSLPDRPSMPLGQILRRAQAEPNAPIAIAQRNTPALFGAGLIDSIPEDVLISLERRDGDVGRLVGLNREKDASVLGRLARLEDGRIGKFGWKGEFASLGDFVEAACANELGLSNPVRNQATPIGRPDHESKGVDLTTEQCSAITSFLTALPSPECRPAVGVDVAKGAEMFDRVGCADCHLPDLGPVKGLFSDLMLHEMGGTLGSASSAYGGEAKKPRSPGSQAPKPGEWRTPPLWGVADSAPYLHDGRAATISEAILAHAGEAQSSLNKFEWLKEDEKALLLSFLGSLRAPSAPPAPSAVAAR